jgi:hypothetical protein
MSSPISYPTSLSFLYTDIISDIISDIVPDIMYDISQDGLVLPLDKEAAGIITGSEEILKEFASKHSLNASTINDLIKDVLKNTAFNAVEVDTDMLQRLPQASIDSGDVQIINMHAEGDREQLLELFKRPVEKVLRELVADMRSAGCQHFGFQEYKDPRGNRLFAGHSNGSVSLLAQLKVVEGKVPLAVSILLYIDGTNISCLISCPMLYPISYPT